MLDFIKWCNESDTMVDRFPAYSIEEAEVIIKSRYNQSWRSGGCVVYSVYDNTKAFPHIGNIWVNIRKRIEVDSYFVKIGDPVNGPT